MLRLANSSMLIFLWVAGAMLLATLYGGRRRRAAMAALGNLEVVQRMAATLSTARRKWKCFMTVTAAVLLAVALSRPQIGTRLETVKRKGIDIIIAIDVSDSMLAQDIKPSRLEAAKQEVAALMDRLQGDRIGLVTFAGTAFVQCPLTLDYGAARMFLDDIEPGIIPQPGTAIGEAIRTATKAFARAERKYKVLILVTDGEDHDTQPIDAAREAHKQGVRIYTIGVGKAEGEPIPIYDEQGRASGYKKDREGNIVLSKLDETSLQKIALATNGKYHHATTTQLELDRVYRDVSKLEEKELLTRKFAQHEDRFQILVLLAFALLIFEGLLSERRSGNEVKR